MARAGHQPLKKTITMELTRGDVRAKRMMRLPCRTGEGRSGQEGRGEHMEADVQADGVAVQPQKYTLCRALHSKIPQLLTLSAKERDSHCVMACTSPQHTIEWPTKERWDRGRRAPGAVNGASQVEISEARRDPIASRLS
jgi:hypothetical protein